MSDSPSAARRVLLILSGPALLLLALCLPCFGPLNARFGFGILFWMVWWWITTAVDIKLTCLVPIFVVCVYSYMPLGKVLEAYVHKEAVLIFGATAITSAWVRWGFAKRLALNFLMRVSGNVRAQTAGWFILCGVTSFVVGNTTVAAMFAPVAVASLMYAGFNTNEERWNSKAASNILIAVAWGASVGGMATPLGGGQSVVTYGLLNKYLGYNIYFIDWTLRMLPVSMLVVLGVGVMMYFMKTDRETFGGSREFYRQELAKLGPMSYEEKVSFYGFALAIALAVLQPPIWIRIRITTCPVVVKASAVLTVFSPVTHTALAAVKSESTYGIWWCVQLGNISRPDPTRIINRKLPARIVEGLTFLERMPDRNRASSRKETISRVTITSHGALTVSRKGSEASQRCRSAILKIATSVRAT